MGLHKINLGKRGVIYTGDGGLEMLNKAFKEEVEKMSGGINYEQLKDEDMHFYKRPTMSELIDMFKGDFTEEEYEELKNKYKKNE